MPDLAPGEGLRIGAGIIRVKRFDEGTDAVFQDIGEYASFAITNDLTELEYKSNKLGTKKTVASIVTEQTAEVELVINSITAANMALALGGTLQTIGANHYRFGYMKNNVIDCEVQLEGTNDYGDQIDYMGRMQLRPSGTYSPISEEWNELTMTGKIIADDDGNFGFWDHRAQGVAFSPPDLASGETA